jgi:aspartyl-tRNA(Asn)/glutamyl-tRNA(Gln) amidotransferase subunit C
MSLTREEVDHIANLARLELGAEEKGHYREQLSGILDFFNRLQQLDTSDIPPTSSVYPAQLSLRPDVPRPGLATDTLLSNAPVTEEKQFRVPPVLE